MVLGEEALGKMALLRKRGPRHVAWSGRGKVRGMSRLGTRKDKAAVPAVEKPLGPQWFWDGGQLGVRKAEGEGGWGLREGATGRDSPRKARPLPGGTRPEKAVRSEADRLRGFREQVAFPLNQVLRQLVPTPATDRQTELHVVPPRERVPSTARPPECSRPVNGEAAPGEAVNTSIRRTKQQHTADSGLLQGSLPLVSTVTTTAAVCHWITFINPPPLSIQIQRIPLANVPIPVQCECPPFGLLHCLNKNAGLLMKIKCLGMDLSILQKLSNAPTNHLSAA
ncbi:PREDICTED: uncharacterized protein LOC101362400 [Odobenus rosmarus divergens]|uniref:Uncharacterized protein LOC101362400 n=1 Tax=Odobenus rosmarus divergens TaxID=9708 RepID=A0A9B0HCG3_ODORO